MLDPGQQRTVLTILAPYRPKLVGIFGSRARGEQRTDSDLDLLVELGVEVDLLELVGIEQDLSEALGLKVDLVTTRAVDPKLEPYVRKDLVRIDLAA